MMYVRARYRSRIVGSHGSRELVLVVDTRCSTPYHDALRSHGVLSRSCGGNELVCDTVHAARLEYAALGAYRALESRTAVCPPGLKRRLRAVVIICEKVEIVSMTEQTIVSKMTSQASAPLVGLTVGVGEWAQARRGTATPIAA